MVTPVTPSSPSDPTFPSPTISFPPTTQTLAVLPDQDSFYDVTDSLEQLGMENIIEKHMKNLRTEPDLRTQFTIYEVTGPTTEEVIQHVKETFLQSVPVCCRMLLSTRTARWMNRPFSCVKKEERWLLASRREERVADCPARCSLRSLLPSPTHPAPLSRPPPPHPAPRLRPAGGLHPRWPMTPFPHLRVLLDHLQHLLHSAR